MFRLEAMAPVRMRRVAIVAPREAMRGALVRVAEAGCIEIDRIDDAGSGGPSAAPGSAVRRLRHARVEPRRAALSAAP
ncbi:ATPase, partial [Streptomyces sp. 4503]|nr:ATPase [Streptomyces niphimycinicus]